MKRVKLLDIHAVNHAAPAVLRLAVRAESADGQLVVVVKVGRIERPADLSGGVGRDAISAAGLDLVPASALADENAIGGPILDFGHAGSAFVQRAWRGHV